MKKISQRRITIAAGAVAVLVLFTSCFGAFGGPEPPTVEDLEPYFLDETTLNNFSTSASEADSIEASGMIFSASFFAAFPLLYVEIALAEWDESASNTYTDETGTYTTTWDRDGDTWTWTISFTDGEETYTIAINVTALSDGWEVVVTQNGEDFLEGLYSEDGSSGLVTFFLGGLEKYVIEWGESSAPGYDINYTVQYYGSAGTVEQELVLDFTTDGSAGAWTYTDYTDATPDASGSWTP